MALLLLTSLLLPLICFLEMDSSSNAPMMPIRCYSYVCLVLHPTSYVFTVSYYSHQFTTRSYVQYVLQLSSVMHVLYLRRRPYCSFLLDTYVGTFIRTYYAVAGGGGVPHCHDIMYIASSNAIRLFTSSQSQKAKQHTSKATWQKSRHRSTKNRKRR